MMDGQHTNFQPAVTLICINFPSYRTPNFFFIYIYIYIYIVLVFDDGRTTYQFSTCCDYYCINFPSYRTPISSSVLHTKSQIDEFKELKRMERQQVLMTTHRSILSPSFNPLHTIPIIIIRTYQNITYQRSDTNISVTNMRIYIKAFCHVILHLNTLLIS